MLVPKLVSNSVSRSHIVDGISGSGFGRISFMSVIDSIVYETGVVLGSGITSTGNGLLPKGAVIGFDFLGMR